MLNHFYVAPLEETIENSLLRQQSGMILQSTVAVAFATFLYTVITLLVSFGLYEAEAFTSLRGE